MIVMALCAIQAMAQFNNLEGNNQRSGNRQQRYRFADHLRYGGNFGMSFGTSATAVQVNPIVGYDFNMYTTAGILATYEYYKYSGGLNDYTNTTYGGGVFAEAHPLEYLNIHAEAQVITYKDYSANYYEPQTRTDYPILIGGGYRKMINNRSSLNIMLLWNINDTRAMRENTTFNNPIVRVSFIL